YSMSSIALAMGSGHGVVNHAGDEQRIVFRRGMTATASILLSIAYLFTLLLLLLLLSILCLE
ncbi:hypothetical protein, partial [Serratia marcescens]|uniref:hypothetical protein n=1 Tax=Serratia marcescens TaxID=615 RepID=UPI001953129C